MSGTQKIDAPEDISTWIMEDTRFDVCRLDEGDLPDLDVALLAEYGERARHSHNVLLASFRWDPDGWFVAKVGGQNVGFIGGCAMNESEAVSGYHVVLPHYRRKGIGKMLWEKLMRYLGNHNMCITSVKSSRQYNQALGFIHDPFTILCIHADPNQAVFDVPATSNVTPYQEIMIDDVIAYDTSVHTIPRPTFLTQWLDTAVTSTFVAHSGGRVTGYGSMQLLPSGLLLIAPVLADDDVTADAILCQLYGAARDRGKSVVMDIVESNRHMREQRERWAMTVQSREYRLHNRWLPQLDMGKAYVLTTDSFSLL